MIKKLSTSLKAMASVTKFPGFEPRWLSRVMRRYDDKVSQTAAETKDRRRAESRFATSENLQAEKSICLLAPNEN